MKKYKRLGILALLLAVLSVATVMLTRYEEKQEQIRNSEEVILEVPTDSVLTLSWENGETSLSFHRDESWVYDGDEAFPVDDEKIAGLLEQFQSFSTAFIIENVEDYGQYGLDEPECVIDFTTIDASYEIRLGNFSTMDEKRYVDIGDGNVYLVTNDPLEQFDAALRDLIRHDQIPAFGQIASLSFSGRENYTIRRDESGTGSYSDYDVYFTGDGRVLDTDNVDYYLYTVEQLNPADYVTYNVTGSELADYGLDTPELTVTVNYSQENEAGEAVTGTFLLSVSRDPQALAEAEEAGESTAVAGYIRVGDSQIVYAVDEETCEALLAASFDDLRHREIFWGEFEDVHQIDITLENQTHTLVAVTGEEETCWYFQEDVPGTPDEETGETREGSGEEAAPSLDMSPFQTALNNLMASEFTSENPTEMEEISLTLHLNRENFSAVEIVLYRYDGTYCLAQVDGETVALVSRSAVVDLMEAVQSMVLH